MSEILFRHVPRSAPWPVRAAPDGSLRVPPWWSPSPRRSPRRGPRADRRVEVVVIGAGQAGLAASRLLTDHGVDHVVLERGRVAERWRSERWDSLRLLTPNWLTRLPERQYLGHDPEGFMSMREMVLFLTDYAASFRAPVEEVTTVTSVSIDDDGYVIATDQGTWRAPNVVIATGPYHEPRVPAAAGRLHPSIAQWTTSDYRRPEDLSDGGVLVVGASSSGVQLAHELRLAGRDVVLAVGSHTNLPRRYRGLDIFWWLDQTRILDAPAIDPVRGERRPAEHSLQLVGDDAGRSLGLADLAALGVRLTGRLEDLGAERASFSDDLADSCRTSDDRRARVLDRIDDHVGAAGLAREVDDPDRPERFTPDPGIERLDLARSGITNVLWATGHRRSYPWLRVPVLDAAGEIRHVGGVTPEPGLYVLGLPFLRSRRSTFIHGAGADAAAVVDHLLVRLGRTPSAAAHGGVR